MQVQPVYAKSILKKQWIFNYTTDTANYHIYLYVNNAEIIKKKL